MFQLFLSHKLWCSFISSCHIIYLFVFSPTKSKYKTKTGLYDWLLENQLWIMLFHLNRTGSNPKIRRNKIWGGQNGGILVYNSGLHFTIPTVNLLHTVWLLLVCLITQFIVNRSGFHRGQWNLRQRHGRSVDQNRQQPHTETKQDPRRQRRRHLHLQRRQRYSHIL